MITFGHVTRKPSAGWILLKVMVALLAVGLVVCDRVETAPPLVAGLHLAGGNMEEKEVRFGATSTLCGWKESYRC
jgi:K+-transporting ATPase A subunit